MTATQEPADEVRSLSPSPSGTNLPGANLDSRRLARRQDSKDGVLKRWPEGPDQGERSHGSGASSAGRGTVRSPPKFDSSDREKYYRYFKRHSAKISPNTEWMCRMLASWSVGRGVLPDALGLEPEHFSAFQVEFFQGVKLYTEAPSGRKADFSRMLEKDDLIRYLHLRAAWPERAETGWITAILVAGCLGDDHLWQDLGLWSRQDLSGLIAYNFPEVASANTHDMKWKKFLYKQLCEAEGIYVCRAPSCAVCVDYPRCFGPEE